MNSLDTYTAALQMLALARAARQLTNDISLSQETRLRRIEELMGDIESCVAGSNQIGVVFQPINHATVSAQVLGRLRPIDASQVEET